VLTNSSDSDRYSSELCMWRNLPMAIRLVITDAVWAELEPVLRTMKHYAGSPSQLSDRLFRKLCCIKLVWVSHGGIYPTTLTTGMQSITAFAVGKLVTSGRLSGNTCNNTAVSRPARYSSIRRSCVPINTPRVHGKKRGPRSPDSWSLSGRIFHQITCRLH
jgi:hypothetical protein